MSPSIIVASGVVIVASLALVALGTAFKWDPTSRPYNRWTRVTGVIAIVALAAAVAWSRAGDLLVALGILLGGAALAVVFVWAHRALSARVQRELGTPDEVPPDIGT